MGEIKWQHIVDLNQQNTGRITETPGLSIVHELKYEHMVDERFQNAC